ncbi:MAG: DUF2829 domain-containing protein [Eubacterium sp.]
MTFGQAFEAIREGNRSMWRSGWEEPDDVWVVGPGENSPYTKPALMLDSRHGLTPWAPTIGDLFAIDWQIRN